MQVTEAGRERMVKEEQEGAAAISWRFSAAMESAGVW